MKYRIYRTIGWYLQADGGITNYPERSLGFSTREEAEAAAPEGFSVTFHTTHRPGKRTIHVANPNDRAWWKPYLFAFGSIGTIYVLAYGSDCSSALDEAADGILDLYPGFRMSDEDADEYECEGWDDAILRLGNAGEPFSSEEVHLLAENPTRDEIIACARGRS